MAEGDYVRDIKYIASTKGEFEKLEANVKKFLEYYAIRGTGLKIVEASVHIGNEVRIAPDPHTNITEIFPIKSYAKYKHGNDSVEEYPIRLITSTPEEIRLKLGNVNYNIFYAPQLKPAEKQK